MMLTVLLFAQAREKAGRSQFELELPDGSCVGDALAAVLRAYPALEPLAPHLAVALDGELAAPESLVRAGAELALLPPVSGG
jgi:molybdopterin synthase catalytic subunit